MSTYSDEERRAIQASLERENAYFMAHMDEPNDVGPCSNEEHVYGCPCQAGGDAETTTTDPMMARTPDQLVKPRCRRCGKRLTSDDTCDSCAFDLSTAIKEQRQLGGYVVAPLSMLRCSECGELLDYFGACKTHGATDA